MASIKRIQPGQYHVSDGRTIIKNGSAWYVLDEHGKIDLGPLPTLKAGKEYVMTGSVSIGNHNTGSQYGRKQSKKEFNAYLASEVKKGNYLPAILWITVLFIFAVIMELTQS